MSEFRKPTPRGEMSYTRRSLSAGIALLALGAIGLAETSCAPWSQPRQSFIGPDGVDIIDPFTGEVIDSKPASPAYERIFRRLNPTAKPGEEGVLVATDIGIDMAGGKKRYAGIDYIPRPGTRTETHELDKREIEELLAQQELQPATSALKDKEPKPQQPMIYKKDPQTLVKESTSVTEPVQGWRVGSDGATGAWQGGWENFMYGFGEGIGQAPWNLLTWGLNGFGGLPQIKINNANQQGQSLDSKFDPTYKPTNTFKPTNMPMNTFNTSNHVDVPHRGPGDHHGPQKKEGGPKKGGMVYKSPH